MAGENDAEDLTQEVFVKINGALADFRGDSELSTWIYRIATRAALDRLRLCSARRAETLDDMGLFEDRASQEDSWTGEAVPSSEDRVIREEMKDCIREIMGRLPDAYRTVMVLCELEGFRDGEAADILGVRLETLKIRLHRARKQLREALSSSCVFYRDERNEFACDRKNSLIPISERNPSSK